MNYKFLSLLFAFLFNVPAFAGSFVCFSTSDPSNLGRTIFEIPMPDGMKNNLVVTNALGEEPVEVLLDQYNIGDVYTDSSETDIAGGYILFNTPTQYKDNTYVSITWITNKYLEDMPATITYMDSEGKMKVNPRGSCTSYE